MAIADRLYEVACECRDLDTRLDSVLRELQKKTELLDAIKLVTVDLLEAASDEQATEESFLPAGVAKHIAQLKLLLL